MRINPAKNPLYHKDTAENRICFKLCFPDSQSVTAVFDLHKAGMLVSRCIGGMERKEQAAVGGTEEHAVTAVLCIEGRHMREIGTELTVCKSDSELDIGTFDER